jgi:putative addiction module component (TIGR02574 family)
MSSVGHKILQDILALPENERAEIAARLIESLDKGADAGVDEAWAAEIERRCAALDAGEAVTSDWEEVRRRIETQLFNK